MNSITVSSSEVSPLEVRMSNGLTAVVITAFGLSATLLAKTESQKRLTVFVLEKDQAAVGIGTVGFSLAEMPWCVETFEEDKQFLLQSLSTIRQEVGWASLDYEPAKELLFPAVDQLIHLVNSLTKEMIDEEAGADWLAAADIDDPVVNDFPKCEKHQLFLSIYGCYACNDT